MSHPTQKTLNNSEGLHCHGVLRVHGSGKHGFRHPNKMAFTCTLCERRNLSGMPERTHVVVCVNSSNRAQSSQSQSGRCAQQQICTHIFRAKWIEHTFREAKHCLLLMQQLSILHHYVFANVQLLHNFIEQKACDFIRKQLVDTQGNGLSHLTSSSRLFSSTSALAPAVLGVGVEINFVFSVLPCVGH